jgi:hypothetical protein
MGRDVGLFSHFAATALLDERIYIFPNWNNWKRAFALILKHIAQSHRSRETEK